MCDDCFLNQKTGFVPLPFIDCPLVGPAGTPYPATNTTVLYKLSLTGLNCTTEANVGDDEEMDVTSTIRFSSVSIG